jgi:hypothetical protein
MRQQATESATLAGALLDLAERRESVTIHTAFASHEGQLVAATRQLGALRLADGGAALIALPAITAVSPLPAWPVGEREPALDLDLADVLAALAADRPSVCLELDGGKRIVGVLEAVGTELVALHLDGDAPGRALIALHAITACLL